jgi:hypothetical protein
MGRPPLARVAGFALGVAIALAIVAVEFEPARTLWLTLAFATAVVGAALAILALRAARRPADADAARIRSDGILGRGTVLRLTPTGRRRGATAEVELDLEVQLPMRRRFEVRVRDWLEPDARRSVVVGGSVVVAADPAEPGHVVLVLDIPEVDAAAIAGLGPIAGGPGGPRQGHATPPGGREAGAPEEERLRPTAGGPAADP